MHFGRFGYFDVKYMTQEQRRAALSNCVAAFGEELV